MLRNPVKIKRLCVGMTAMLMVVLAAFSVFGKEVPDVNRQGSISLTLQDSQSGAYMEDGAVTLYQVGEIRVDDGNYSWQLSGAFSGSGLSLENLSSGQLAQELKEYADQKKIEGSTVRIGEKGSVVFENLKPGLYLLAQKETMEDVYAFSPFLVSVPVQDGESWQYEVNATPKVGIIEEISLPDSPDIPVDSHLPQTGQLNWPVPVLAVSGVLFFALGWGLCYAKRKKYHAQ